MSVIVFAESWEGKFKKATFEAVSYARSIADLSSTNVVAVAMGELTDDINVLAEYGADKIVHVNGGVTSSFNATAWSEELSNIANTEDGNIVVISGSNNGKMLAPFTSVALDAAYISNAVEVPSSVSPVTVKRSAFSNKGYVDYKSDKSKTVISFVPNSIGSKATAGSADVAEVASSASPQAGVEVIDVQRVAGKIPLTEADIVVSAGRGMKAPENWNIIEELAETLGAGTACSKPVSDIGWRPHSEHVGQTGIQINPSLYIAIGISGAIQHLAGVSGSKTIVVINNDPEAPFFKAADYGIVGDAFEVVPQLTAAIKNLKGN